MIIISMIATLAISYIILVFIVVWNLLNVNLLHIDEILSKDISEVKTFC